LGEPPQRKDPYKDKEGNLIQMPGRGVNGRRQAKIDTNKVLEQILTKRDDFVNSLNNDGFEEVLKQVSPDLFNESDPGMELAKLMKENPFDGNAS
jgi:hypothetical protein